MGSGTNTFVLVSFRKAKYFHPNFVKLKQTHTKNVLLESEIQNPKNYFRHDTIKLDSFDETGRPINPVSKYDYRITQHEHKYKFSLECPIGYKATCSFSSSDMSAKTVN